MKVARHKMADGTYRFAKYSDCGRYRIQLSIRWNFLDDQGYVNFLMLNPSTATELANDPTVEGCEQRARAWGFDGCVITNIFSYRATDPVDMKAQPEPIGEGNDQSILENARAARLVVCGWGNHGEHLRRGKEVAKILTDAGIRLSCLAVNGTGHPQHPLFIPRSVPAQDWVPNIVGLPPRKRRSPRSAL